MKTELRQADLEMRPVGEKDTPLKTALAELRCCCNRALGIKACKQGHFDTEAWLRDAAEGAKAFLVAGEKEDQPYVLRVLELFLEPEPPYPYLISYQPPFFNHIDWRPLPGHERRDRQLPFSKRIGNFPHIPLFREVLIVDSFQVSGLLGECLSSSSFSQRQRGELWKNYGERAKAGLKFYQDRFSDSQTDLITKEDPLTGRQDCILKSGAVCLTNVHWYETFCSLARGVSDFDPEWSRVLEGTAQKIKESFNEKFWMEDKGYYRDWDEKGRSHDNFDSLANFQAIVFGLADENQAERILKFAKREELRNEFGLTEAVWPAYEPSVVSGNVKRLNHGKYYDHGGGCWPEITCFHGLALKKSGRVEEAEEKLEVVERLLRIRGTLHESYDELGQPKSITFFPSFTFLPRSIRQTFGHNACEGFTMALAAYIRAKTSLPEDLL